MNSLQAYNQINSNMVQIYKVHRSNEAKTMQYIDVIENKKDVANQVNIREAIDNLRVGNYVKGTIINMMA